MEDSHKNAGSLRKALNQLNSQEAQEAKAMLISFNSLQIFQQEEIVDFLITHDQWEEVVKSLDSTFQNEAYRAVFIRVCTTKPPMMISILTTIRQCRVLSQAMRAALENAFISLCNQTPLRPSTIRTLKGLKNVYGEGEFSLKMLEGLGKALKNPSAQEMQDMFMMDILFFIAELKDLLVGQSCLSDLLKEKQEAQ